MDRAAAATAASAVHAAATIEAETAAAIDDDGATRGDSVTRSFLATPATKRPALLGGSLLSGRFLGGDEAVVVAVPARELRRALVVPRGCEFSHRDLAVAVGIVAGKRIR